MTQSKDDSKPNKRKTAKKATSQTKRKKSRKAGQSKQAKNSPFNLTAGKSPDANPSPDMPLGAQQDPIPHEPEQDQAQTRKPSVEALSPTQHLRRHTDPKPHPHFHSDSDADELYEQEIRNFDEADMDSSTLQSSFGLDLEDDPCTMPNTQAFANHIQALLWAMEREWIHEMRDAYDHQAYLDPKKPSQYLVPASPMRFCDAVAYQILTGDTRLIEAAVSALGFAMLPAPETNWLTARQLATIKNLKSLLEAIEQHGVSKKKRKDDSEEEAEE